MAKLPTVIVQLSDREKVAAFRAGSGDAPGLVALGVDPETFRTLPGIDAFYLSLTRAERWGSRPLPPYTAALLETTAEDQRAGMPAFIVTGLVLRQGDANTAEFCIPLLVKALSVIDQANAIRPGAIRTLGFFEFELTFAGASLTQVGRLLADSLSG